MSDSRRPMDLFSDKFNQGTRETNLVHEVWNSFANWGPLMGKYPDFDGYFNQGRAIDLGAAPKRAGKPCVIIGSGPSLDKSIEKLKDWKHDIMCSTSHAATLMYHGIKPTYILALDFRSNFGELDAESWPDDIPLICTPGVMPDLINEWPGPMWMFRQNVHTSAFYGNAQRLAFSAREILPNMGRWKFQFYIPTEITMFGCAPACELFAVDLLGYNPIYLIGGDFSFREFDHYRFTRWGWNEEKGWHIYPQKSGDDPSSQRKEWTQKVGDSELIGNRQLFFYKKNFLSAVRLAQLKQRRVVMHVDEGDSIITNELPKCKIDDVIAQQGKLGERIKPWPKSKYVKETEEYLAKLHTFVLETSNGLIFVESVNPADEVRRFITQIDSVYICRSCQEKINVWNPKFPHSSMTYSETKCQKCQANAVEKEAVVDKEANMKRVVRLHEKFHSDKKAPVAVK